MPTVLRVGPYRFFFYSGDGYSGDGREPPHGHVEVHVERDDSVAKFWLPVRLARNGGFGRAEVRDNGRLVDERKSELLEAWNAYFGD